MRIFDGRSKKPVSFPVIALSHFGKRSSSFTEPGRNLVKGRVQKGNGSNHGYAETGVRSRNHGWRRGGAC